MLGDDAFSLPVISAHTALSRVKTGNVETGAQQG